MRILFLADPNSLHDIKWMSYFSNEFECYLIAREEHLRTWNIADFENFYKQYSIEIIGSINDFSVKYFYRTLKEGKRLNRILSKYNIQIFHVMYADPNALWGVFRSKPSSQKWVLTTRGSDILKGIPAHFKRKDPFNKLISFLYTKALKKFDKITCTSQLQKSNIQHIIRKESTEVIRTGVDVCNILKDTKEFQNLNLIGRNYVLFPRNMRPIYYHELSLAAIKLLPKGIKGEYTFVFVDKDNSDKEYVEKISSLMMQDREAKFLFLTKQSQGQIWQLYKNASLVVMNPLSDGSPVSAMEAMLCGTPVILSNLSYDEEIFGGVTIKLLSWQPEELADKIYTILSEKIKMDNAVTERIIQKGNRVVEMEKLKQIYLS